MLSDLARWWVGDSWSGSDVNASKATPWGLRCRTSTGVLYIHPALTEVVEQALLAL